MTYGQILTKYLKCRMRNELGRPEYGVKTMKSRFF